MPRTAHGHGEWSSGPSAAIPDAVNAPQRPPTRLFVLRHGAVDPAWNGRIYGALDVPLSPLGEGEARRAARRLGHVPLDAVISSHLSRARFGAECLRAECLRMGRALQASVDPELRELERGEWAGLAIEALQATSPGAWEAWRAAPDRLRPPGGESLSDLAARVLPRFAHWAAAHPGGAIALVVHGWVLRVLTCHALGLDVSRAPFLDVRTGDVMAFDWPASPLAVPELAAWALDRIPGRLPPD